MVLGAVLIDGTVVEVAVEGAMEGGMGGRWVIEAVRGIVVLMVCDGVMNSAFAG